jgi:hypothetical protein
MEPMQYVEKLELAEPTPMQIVAFSLNRERALRETHPEAGKPEAYVDAGSMVSFVSNVSEMHRVDSLNSTLLAQLAADKKYDPYNDTDNWYKFYRTVLSNIGWVTENFGFTKYGGGGATITMEKVVLEILGAMASQDQLGVVRKTLDALKSLSDQDGRLVLFESSSTNVNKGDFQIGIAGESNGLLVLKIGAMNFKADQKKKKFLFFGYNRASMEVFYSSQNMTLNETVHARVRQAIVEKLGSRAETFIDEIEI